MLDCIQCGDRTVVQADYVYCSDCFEDEISRTLRMVGSIKCPNSNHCGKLSCSWYPKGREHLRPSQRNYQVREDGYISLFPYCLNCFHDYKKKKRNEDRNRANLKDHKNHKDHKDHKNHKKQDPKDQSIRDLRSKNHELQNKIHALKDEIFHLKDNVLKLKTENIQLRNNKTYVPQLSHASHLQMQNVRRVVQNPTYVQRVPFKPANNRKRAEDFLRSLNSPEHPNFVLGTPDYIPIS